MKYKVLDTAQSYPNFNPIDETDFERIMKDEAEPFLDKLRTVRYIRTADNKEIYCETFVPDGFASGNSSQQKQSSCRGLVVLFHGFCEFCSKLDELSYYMLRQGFALCRFDQFGHGFSGREIKHGSKVHIRRFQTYVDCAYEVVRQVAVPLATDLGKRLHNRCDSQEGAQNVRVPLLLFAHSMGGTVAALFLQQYPDIFTAAALSAPMFELTLPGMSEASALILLKFIRLFGAGSRFLPGHGEFNADYRRADYKKSLCSERRISYHFNKRKAEVRFQTWGGTFAWLDESLKAIRRIFKSGNLCKITVPVLLLQAEKDETVSLGGQNRFTEHVASARLAVCKDASHELYNGTNEILLRWYPELFRFYDEFAP